MAESRPVRWARFAWRAVLFEIGLYRSLARWLARRPAVPDGAVAIGYAQASTPVMWLWIFASAAELPLVHVLVPWEGIRLALLVVGVWGLAWMVGLLASMHVHPHLLTAEALRVRNGPRHDIAVPWSAVRSARVHDRDLPSSLWTLQPRETAAGTDLQVGMSGRVNVELHLVGPTTVLTEKGPLEVTQVCLWADDPRAVVRAVNERVGSPA
jgi:hypothetical protein